MMKRVKADVAKNTKKNEKQIDDLKKQIKDLQTELNYIKSSNIRPKKVIFQAYINYRLKPSKIQKP